MESKFFVGFDNETIDINILKRIEAGCPNPPATTKVSAEGRANYSTLALGQNSANGYGMTALMAMNTWQSQCYGEVRPGYVFLFPGIYSFNPPPYQGTVSINCQPHAPINSASGGTLHGQMCALLGRPTSDFIGFAINYPFNVGGNTHYNSATCNPYWFNGSRTIPVNCDGVNWQQIVYNTLMQWLPH